MFLTTINKPIKPIKKLTKSNVSTVFLLPIIENISLGLFKACKLSGSEKSSWDIIPIISGIAPMSCQNKNIIRKPRMYLHHSFLKSNACSINIIYL